MLNQMLGELIADEKDGTAAEAKGIAAFRPTLGASSREIAALNKLIEVCRSRSSSREIAALNKFVEALQKQIELDAK